MNRHERRKYKALHGTAALRVKMGGNLYPFMDVNRQYGEQCGFQDGDLITIAGVKTTYQVRFTDGLGVLT